MCSDAITAEITQLLLASMSQDREEGLPMSFMFGAPGAPPWQMNIGTEVFFKPNLLTRAALLTRQKGPVYLRYLPIGEIQRMLQDFVQKNFGHIANDVLFRQFTESYDKVVSPQAKARFASALIQSEIFQAKDQLSLFPLVPIAVQRDFNATPFFLVQPASLREWLPEEIDRRQIAPDVFPPLTDWEGQRQKPAAWLGIRSPVVRAAQKMKAAILGAVALTPRPQYRYMFSMRALFGGICTLGEGATTRFPPEPHTPALMHDIAISETDHSWLRIVAEKLRSQERTMRRQMTALEYFYRAWATDPSERFPLLCMTLDSIYGDANQATSAVIDGVRGTVGDHVSDVRLRDLMALRASVIHGGAPDVYDSRKYGRYYDSYGADPIHDMELVVAKCLRLKIFGDAMTVHADPNAAILAEAQRLGRYPKRLRQRTIFSDHEEDKA